MTIQNTKSLNINSKDNYESTDTTGWPDGLYETTLGAWAGEPLIREPQGEYEQRLKLNDNQSENMD
ncbi:hypothetical protein [Nitrosomonas ureae]|uniref:Uncharacterized protein n=1 Tax=Nitrosomonas ureae TaxID=44577 RepID=A0A2T5IUK5_9PROT|nr:hypothetical protein [Nitrosomonas ureae]PTQ87503.1 hypothetical protein C8R28_1005110 [Nitrosomonas ureae]PXX17113.1 hypothetical protein C8R27_1043 [Nitrosomonas ureae]